MGSVFNVSETGDMEALGSCTTGEGVYLPTTGGTQEILNFNGTEIITFQMTGSVTPTFNFPVKFSRTGKLVIMQWDGFQKSTTNQSDFLFTADLVPPRYLPAIASGDPLTWLKIVIDGASVTDFALGNISFGPSGNINIGVGVLGSNFTNAKCGILSSSISYCVL